MRDAYLKIELNQLKEIFENKYGRDPSAMGWGPRIRSRFAYFTPDDYYEAMVSRLVIPHSSWLDVGSGRNVFPSNRSLARTLAKRCEILVGVDPDATIFQNDIVHERVKECIENYCPNRTFDVVTMRMAAEHVTDPDRVVAALGRLTKPGGRVVVYTINRWSPIPILTWLVPFRLHHLPKRLLWNSDPEDTFPVAYRMNTRRALQSVFTTHGFREVQFSYLDDCRTFAAYKPLLVFELSCWRGLRAMGIRYPETCLLGVYQRR